MEPQDFNKLEDLIIKAVQSGKRETSGLVAEIMKSINETNLAVEKAAQVASIASIKATELASVVEEIKNNNLMMHEQNTRTLKEIQEKLEPIAKVYNSVDGSGKLFRWIAKWIFIPLAAIITMLLTLKELLRK
jgi:hypothetical protein